MGLQFLDLIFTCSNFFERNHSANWALVSYTSYLSNSKRSVPVVIEQIQFICTSHYVCTLIKYFANFVSLPQKAIKEKGIDLEQVEKRVLGTPNEKQIPGADS